MERQKWQADVKYFFALGTSGLSADHVEKIQKESEENDDLLLLTLTDTYDRLTNKMLHIHRALDQGFVFKYMLKVDDDCFVRLSPFVGNVYFVICNYGTSRIAF